MPLVLAAGYLVATRGASDGDGAPRASSAAAPSSSSALVTPLDTLAREYLVWAHLLQNVVLAEWAPLLLVLGVPPRARRAHHAAAAGRALTHPFVALPLWVGTYAPGMCRRSTTQRCGTRTRCCPRARDVPRHRPPVLVVRLAGRAAPPVLGRAGRLRLRRVRPLGAARARARPRTRAALRLLRRRSRARVGALPADDQQLGGMTMAGRAVGRLLRRLRVLVPALPLRAGAVEEEVA